MRAKRKVNKPMRSRLSVWVPSALKARLKEAGDQRGSSMTEMLILALEMALVEPPISHIPTGPTWVDELAGSARFTDADIEGDDRLERLVKWARTKRTP